MVSADDDPPSPDADPLSAAERHDVPGPPADAPDEPPAATDERKEGQAPPLQPSPGKPDEPTGPPPAATEAGAPAGPAVPARPGPLLACLIGGLLFGVAEWLLARPTGSPRVAVLVAALYASVPPVMLGLVLSGALALGWRKPALVARVRATVARFGRSAPDRGPVVALHAWTLGILAALGVGAVGALLVLPRLLGLQESKLGLLLAVGASLGIALLVTLAAALVQRLVRGWLGRVDQRRALPLPARPMARWSLYVAAPVTLGGLGFAWAYEALVPLLGLLARVAALASLLPLVGAAARAFRPLGRRAVRLSLFGSWLVLVVGLGLIAGRVPALGEAGEAGPVAALGASWLRELTDLDRDGASSLFGGNDCAAFDAARAPGATEIRGNRVDEDCDGKDLKALAGAVPEPQYWGRLGSGQVRKYNVVWVVIEAVRGDRVNWAGYRYPTMPRVAELAAESLVFTNAYSTASATELSVPSMLVGRDPAAMNWQKVNGRLQSDEAELTIMERLKPRGYRTGLVMPNLGTLSSLHPDVDSVLTLLVSTEGNKFWTNRGAPITAGRMVQFLTEQAPKASSPPFFLWAYFPDPHSPYRRQPDLDTSALPAGEEGDYDAELLFSDRYLGLVLDALRARPTQWAETIVIVTADHGEEFGEHEGSRHGRTCHQESTHVPLLVRIPGIEGRRIDSPVSLVDLVPTLLELTGTPRTGELHGQSLLVPALGSPEQIRDRALFCAVVSYKAQQGTFYRRAVRQAGYALLEDVVKRRRSLYRLADDPGEQRDLASDPAQADLVRRLTELLAATKSGNLADHRSFRGPVVTTTAPPEPD